MSFAQVHGRAVAVRDCLLGTEYVWFGNQPVAQTFTDASLSTRYAFTDHLGTPIVQTDSAGTVVWRAEYEPYGRVYAYRAGNAGDPQSLRFPGQEADDLEGLGGTDLSYNIFRWYREGWGRYTSADPIGLRGGINQFAYTFDNPIRWTDQTGMCVCMFKGNIGHLTVAANCKGKLPTWTVDGKNAPATAAVAGTAVTADGFVLGGVLYKIEGSTCVEFDCSGSGFAMSTCVNGIACLLGKREPYAVPSGTFGGPPKEPPSGAYPPLAK